VPDLLLSGDKRGVAAPPALKGRVTNVNQNVVEQDSLIPRRPVNATFDGASRQPVNLELGFLKVCDGQVIDPLGFTLICLLGSILIPKKHRSLTKGSKQTVDKEDLSYPRPSSTLNGIQAAHHQARSLQGLRNVDTLFWVGSGRHGPLRDHRV